MDKARRSGAQLLVDALVEHSVDRVFCVPGESYLAVLDALYDNRNRIETVTCRHEGGAAIMAEADGKLLGRPGICMVSRGPGAANASAGVHIARQDSTPLILFIGQAPTSVLDREAFQEIDYRHMFGTVAKWTAQIDSAARVPEYLSRAFAEATSGRPGPVVLALPEDMIVAEAMPSDTAPFEAVETYPSTKQMRHLDQLMQNARQPIMMVGGSRWDDESCASIQRFAESRDLPVVAAFRSQDLFDNDHPNYVGDVGPGLNPKLRARISAADLVIAVGTRLGEMETDNYQLLSIPVPRQQLVHVNPGAEELGKVYRATLAINASPRGFADLLADIRPVKRPIWAEWRRQARADYEQWQIPDTGLGRLQMASVIAWLRDNLPVDAIVTNGAGNFTAWIHRFYRYRRFGSQLAPTSGSMGYGVPAAIAAKLRFPLKTVVCVAGDGDFMMTGQELATAFQHNAAIIVLVVDNGMFGTIRMHQERHHPGRTIATDLRNPDFVALAHAYGAFAESVETTEQFAAAFGRASSSGKLALLHLKTDREALTPSQSLSQIRALAQSTV